MSHLERIIAAAPDYYPSDEVVEQINAVTLAPLIGPVAVGKSTCMNQVISMNPTFGRVQSFTTRPRRHEEAEDDYRFLAHNNTSLGQIASAVATGELVQFAVHPTTGFVYGSNPSDYPKTFMMLDALASSIPAVRHVPFGKIVEISIVAEPEQWEQRFAKRNPDPVDAKKRILEGQSSLRWSLEQGDSMIWVCNSSEALPEVGEEIVGVISGSRDPNLNNRLIGERLLTALETLI